MKKKLRKIHVGDEDFHWAISNDKEGYIMLHIYRAKLMNCPWIVRFNFHDPWLYFGEWSQLSEEFKPITPGKVADIIRKIQFLIKRKGLHSFSASELNFHISKEDDLYLM